MMKKILAVALVIMALFCSTVVTAEGNTIDFSAYTLDELYALRVKLENELLNRTGFQSANMIHRGRYVVGKDIAAGQYTFTCVEASLGSGGLHDNGKIELLKIDDQKAFEKNGSGTRIVFSTNNLSIGQGATLTLDPGMILEINSCSGTLVECNQSWAVRDGSGNSATSQNETTSSSKEATNVKKSELRPEFKESMDQYESFFNRYVELLSMDDIGYAQLAEYLDLIQKSSKMQESFDAWDGKMSDAELEYYLDVQKRVLLKLATLD